MSPPCGQERPVHAKVEEQEGREDTNGEDAIIKTALRPYYKRRGGLTTNGAEAIMQTARGKPPKGCRRSKTKVAKRLKVADSVQFS